MELWKRFGNRTSRSNFLISSCFVFFQTMLNIDLASDKRCLHPRVSQEGRNSSWQLITAAGSSFRSWLHCWHFVFVFVFVFFIIIVVVPLSLFLEFFFVIVVCWKLFSIVSLVCFCFVDLFAWSLLFCFVSSQFFVSVCWQEKAKAQTKSKQKKENR